MIPNHVACAERSARVRHPNAVFHATGIPGLEMPQGGAKPSDRNRRRDAAAMPPTHAQDASDRQPRMLGRAPSAPARLTRSPHSIVEEQIDELLNERYTIVIVTDNLQQATPAANATAFMLRRGAR